MNDHPGAWQVGSLVDNLYEVRAVITSGGMGLVYRVHHRGWHIDLAVKTPNAESIGSPDRMHNFETEAEAWVSLGLHPHVVACAYVRRMDGLPRVFAEWVDGGSLADSIATGRLYAGERDAVLARIFDIAIQFAWGLAHAHASGLIHQDVKPANLMLTADNTAKVTDFGLAKAREAAGETPDVTSTTGRSVLAGYGGLTPAYCSPEQADAARSSAIGERSRPLSRGTDMWSWAISVWQMFVGECPVAHGQVAAEAFSSYLEDPDVDPAIPAMPMPLAALLARCLARDPAHRPSTFDAVADELVGIYGQLLNHPYPRARPDQATLRADGLNNHALSLFDLGHRDRAGQLWQQALKADPHHPHSVYNYGLDRWRRGLIRDDELIGELEAMCSSQPDPLLAEHLLGRAHSERGGPGGLPGIAARDRVTAVDAALSTALSIDSGMAIVDNLVTGTSLTIAGAAAAALSADGRTIFAGTNTGDVWLADARTGRLAYRHPGHSGPIQSVCVDESGRTFVTGSVDGTARIWDAETGTCRHVLDGHQGEVNTTAISADGRVVLTADEREVPRSMRTEGKNRVWDARTGICRQELRGPTQAVVSAALSADGRIALTGSDDYLAGVWDTATGRCVQVLRGHNWRVEAVALNADATIAVTYSLDPRTGTPLFSNPRSRHQPPDDECVARVWDLRQLRCRRSFHDFVKIVDCPGRHRLPMIGLADGQGGRTIVGRVAIDDWPRASWSYAKPVAAQDVSRAQRAVNDAVGRAKVHIGSGQWRDAAAELRAARATTGHLRDPELIALWRQIGWYGRRTQLNAAWHTHQLRHDNALGMGLDPTGRFVIAGADPARVWDTETGECVLSIPGFNADTVNFAFAEDGNVLVTGGPGRGGRLWEMSSGLLARELAGHWRKVRTAALSGDGRTAATGSEDGRIKIWDVRTGRCSRTLRARNGAVYSVALNRDGTVVLCGTRGQAQAWDLASGRELYAATGLDGIAWTVQLSDDGCSAMALADETPRIWDTATGDRTHAFPVHTDSWQAAALARRGDIAVTGTFDGKTMVWEVGSGRLLHTLGGQVWKLSSVSLSADSRIALTGNHDSTVRLWDLETGECLRQLDGHTAPVESVALSADAHVAVTCSRDLTLRVWNLYWDYTFD